jgi:hypothetical protein
MIKKYFFPALLLACPSIVYTTIKIFYLNAFIATQTYSTVISVVNILLGIGLMFAFLYRFKRIYANDNAAFKELFLYGTKLVLTCSLIAATTISTIIKVNEKALTSIIDNSVNLQIEKIAETKGEISAKQRQVIEQMVAVQKNPLTLFAINLFMIFIIGSIYNLVASGILKSAKQEVKTG